MVCKITLFLMSKKGLAVLEEILDVLPSEDFSVVVGQDTQVGNDFSPDILKLCEKHGVRSCLRREHDGKISSDYAMAVSWRWLIDFPSDRLIVLHDSLLPKFRGFAPLPNALIKGERRIGVTALFGSEKYDRGDIIAQEPLDISYPITIGQAVEALSANYRSLARGIATRIARSERLTGQPQDDAEATYSIWRDAADYRIDWTTSASEIRRFIDAVGAPYGGARTSAAGAEVVITAAQEQTDVECVLRHPGKVIFVENGLPVVICGSGLLKITGGHILNGEKPMPLLPLARFRTRFE